MSMGADQGRQTFDRVSWWTLGGTAFWTVTGIAFITYSQPGFIVLGAVLLIFGGIGLVSVVGSRQIEISDVGVTTRRFFRWTRTYPRSELRPRNRRLVSRSLLHAAVEPQERS